VKPGCKKPRGKYAEQNQSRDISDQRCSDKPCRSFCKKCHDPSGNITLFAQQLNLKLIG
jgi:hypothetical protein